MPRQIYCPKCGLLTGHDLVGYEIRGVYDGVLFWVCKRDKLAFQRWPEGHHLNLKAQRHIDEFNAEVSA